MLSRMRGVPNGSVPGAQEGPILSSGGSPGTYTFNITEASPLSGILEREADCSWGPAAVPVTVPQTGELSVGAHFLSSPAEPPNSHRPWGPRARTALGGCETDGPLHLRAACSPDCFRGACRRELPTGGRHSCLWGKGTGCCLSNK